MFRCLPVWRLSQETEVDTAIYWLLTEHDGPLYEVRVSTYGWSQPFGDCSPSVGATKKLNRRALDDLYNPGLVAVGAIKVSVANGAYRCEIHQIVAGAEEHDLKRVFVPSEKVEAASFIWAKKLRI